MKRKNSMNVGMNKNNAIIGVLVVALLLVTGILPAVIELVLGLVFGILGLFFGLIGLVVGLVSGVFGLIIGLAPILVSVAIVYFIVQHVNRDDNSLTKRKNDEAYI